MLLITSVHVRLIMEHIQYMYISGKYGRFNKSLEVTQRPLTVILGCKDQDSLSKSGE